MKLSVAIMFIIWFSFLLNLQADERLMKINQLFTVLSSDESFSGVVLVAEKGNIIYHKAFGLANREWGIRNSLDTKFKIGSVSKPFTAILCLQMVDKGVIDLNGTIAEFLPEYSGPGADKITIKYLLTHTSGIICSPKNESVVERLSHKSTDFIKYVESDQLLFEPGEGFSYSNLGYSLLALILEKVSQISYPILLEQNIFVPLGMNNTKQYDASIVEKYIASGYEYKLLEGFTCASWIDPSYALGCGGLISTTQDLFRFDQALYSGRLLPDSLKDKMFSPTKYKNYGYGWELDNKKLNNGEDSVKIYSHSGSINGFGAYIARIERDSLFIAILKNNRTDTYISPAYATQIGNQVISVLYGEEIEIPKKSIAKQLGFIIGKSGIKKALSEYNSIKDYEADKYNLEEAELNKLGIELYFRFKKSKEALKIFEANMQEFPCSYNTYDSYAFILKEIGDTLNAVKFYKKGLEVLDKYPKINSSESIQKDSENAMKFIKEFNPGV